MFIQIVNQVTIVVENTLSFRAIDALRNKLEEESRYLEEEIRTEYNFHKIIGKSIAFKRALQLLEPPPVCNCPHRGSLLF